MKTRSPGGITGPVWARLSTPESLGLLLAEPWPSPSCRVPWGGGSHEETWGSPGFWKAPSWLSVTLGWTSAGPELQGTSASHVHLSWSLVQRGCWRGQQGSPSRFPRRSGAESSARWCEAARRDCQGSGKVAQATCGPNETKQDLGETEGVVPRPPAAGPT